MASTVIDSLIVKLGLDSSDFESGQKKVAGGLDDTRKATDRVGGDIAASGKKASEFFGQLEKAALKFFTVLTVGRGLSDFTRTIIGTGAQLDRVSSRMGVSADVISRWQGAVRQSGGSADGLVSTLQGLSNEMTSIQQTGQSAIIPILNQIGVGLVDTNGKAKSTVQLLSDIGDAMESKQWDKATKFNLLSGMGIDEGTTNLLLKGKAERDKLLASQKAYSDADAKAAREAQEHWEGVKLQIERATQELIIKALPTIEKLTNLMIKFADTAVPILLEVGDAIGKADDATGGWSTALIGILATLRLIGGPGVLGGIGLLKSSIAGLALAGAGYAGYKAGEEINEHFIKGTKAENVIGESVARVLAFFGNKEAQQALDTNAGINPDEKSVSTGTIDRGSNPGASRAERNNNPGNLEFRGQQGAAPESGSGRFAKFNSQEEGVAALAKQLQRYGSKGIDTLRSIISKYAPASENDTSAYIGALSKKMGVGYDQKLDLNDQSTLSGLIKGISQHESGKDFLSDNSILTGLQMNQGNNSKQMAPSMTVGQVNVYTQASDANGIARDLRGAMIRQADTGIN